MRARLLVKQELQVSEQKPNFHYYIDAGNPEPLLDGCPLSCVSDALKTHCVNGKPLIEAAPVTTHGSCYSPAVASASGPENGPAASGELDPRAVGQSRRKRMAESLCGGLRQFDLFF